MTTEWLKKKRAGVLVDHRQNGHGKTIASVYSVRPKPGAPVSTPLRWEELTEDVRPRDFSMAGRARARRAARRPLRAGAARRAVARAGVEGAPGAGVIARGRLGRGLVDRDGRRDPRPRVRDLRVGPVGEPGGARCGTLAARGAAARVLMPSRPEDPPQKVGFLRRQVVPRLGQRRHRRGDGRGHLPRDRGPQRRQRHRGAPRLVPANAARPGAGTGEHAPLEDFRRLTRDLYIAPGEVGFWQGAFRDPAGPGIRGSALGDRGAAADRDRGAVRRPRARPALDHPLLAHAARGRALDRLGRPPLAGRPAGPALGT